MKSKGSIWQEPGIPQDHSRNLYSDMNLNSKSFENPSADTLHRTGSQPPFTHEISQNYYPTFPTSLPKKNQMNIPVRTKCSPDLPTDTKRDTVRLKRSNSRHSTQQREQRNQAVQNIIRHKHIKSGNPTILMQQLKQGIKNKPPAKNKTYLNFYNLQQPYADRTEKVSSEVSKLSMSLHEFSMRSIVFSRSSNEKSETVVNKTADDQKEEVSSKVVTMTPYEEAPFSLAPINNDYK